MCSRFLGREEIAAVLAQTDLLKLVGRDSALVKTQGKYKGLCPIHAERTPSFFVDPDKQVFYCFGCGAGGDAIAYVQAAKELSFPGAVEYLSAGSAKAERSEFMHRQRHTVETTPKFKPSHRRIFEDEARCIQPGDPAHSYLTLTRGIPLSSVPPDLRYHPALDYWIVEDENPVSIGQFDAMLAGIRDDSGELTGYQRYYLTSNGEKIEKVRPELRTKKISGSVSGGSVRLYPAKDIIMLAEGIETALAACFILGLPCWAALSSTNMPKVKVPGSVSEIHICIDADVAGEKAAESLASRLLIEGKRVFYRRVPTGKNLNDWADVLEVLEP